MAAAPPAVGLPAAVPPAAPTGLPTWRELFAAADRVFAEPVVPYGVLSAAFFASADPPEALLNKLERLAQASPVMVALSSEEDPDRISLLKNPRRFVGSLLNPSGLDGLLCLWLHGCQRPEPRCCAHPCQRLRDRPPVQRAR